MKYAGLIASCLALILVACGPGLLADPAPTATPALTETVAARRTSNYETEIPPVTLAVPTLAAPSEPTVVVPFGEEADLPNYHLKVKVLGITRPADAIVAKAGAPHYTPNANEEWLQVRLQLTCTQTGGTCDDDPFLVKLQLVGVQRFAGQIAWDENPPPDELFFGDVRMEVAAGKTLGGSCYYIVPKSLDKVELDLLESPEFIFETSK